MSKEKMAMKKGVGGIDGLIEGIQKAADLLQTTKKQK